MKEKIKHLKDLLIRLEDRSLRPDAKLPAGVSYSSDLTISYIARQEINEITDIEYIPVFKELLSKEKVTKNKINLITYLIRLADKHNRNDIADYILGLVRKEKTRWVNDVSLSGLNQSTLEVKNEREILFDLATHKDWQIRFDSFGLLSKLPREYHIRIEELCLDQIEQNKLKDHLLRVLASTLSKVGTKKSIPLLKEVIKNSKKTDVILSGLNAVNKLNGTNELNFFLKTYEEKKDSFVKKNLISLITHHGNSEQTELLSKRLKSILSRKRKTNWVYSKGTEPEIVTILNFLDKNNKEEFEKLLKWITVKKMDKLDNTETDWIKEKMKTT
ncbi:MAG: hypothetical protein AB8F94_25530 [Saprospiraceae bacterium]